MASTPWSLTDEQRQETIKRTSENIFALAYNRGRQLTDKQAAAAAAQIEEKAFTVAKVESETTTGQRPAEESLKAYIRKLGALLVQWVSKDGDGQQAAQPVGKVVDLTGDREFFTRESAERALAPLFKPASAITRVKLSTKSFGSHDNSAEVAAKAFQASAATLTDVDLSDVIAGRPEAEALAALKTMCNALAEVKLRRLDLSDNALGEKGVRACASAFANQEGLEFLAFQNVGCSINACAAVKELFANPAQLKGFHFYNNMSDDEGAASIAEILSRAPAILDFKMASSRVGAAGGTALARGLKAGHQLAKLDLSDNPMTSDVAVALADLVSSHSQLRSLNLNDTSLGDEGVTVLSRALAESAPDLEELELALNEITAESAKVLAQSIAKKKKLALLNLRENELEDRGALLIAAGLTPLTSLATVDLTQNQIRRAGALAVAKALKHSSGLQLLALDENEISDAGIDVLKEVMESNGLSKALGSLDENDADAADDEEEASVVGDDKDELVAAFQKAGIA